MSYGRDGTREGGNYHVVLGSTFSRVERDPGYAVWYDEDGGDGSGKGGR